MEEVQNFQRDGILFEDDLYWHEGQNCWHRVSQLAPTIINDETKPKILGATWGLPIIDRYMVRRASAGLATAVTFIYILILSYDLIIYAEGFLGRGLTLKSLAKYYALQTPKMIISILPISFLAALLYTFASLTRSNEITAMQVAGMSCWRIFRPLGVLAILLSASHYILSVYIIPKCGVRLYGAEVTRVESQMGKVENTTVKPLYVASTLSKAVLSGKSYDLRDRIINQPTLEARHPDGGLINIYPSNSEESRAVWAGGNWVFERVMVEVKAKGEQLSQRKPSFTISTNIAPFGITAEHVEAACWYQQLNERSQRKPLHLSTAEIAKQRHLVSGIQSTVNLKGYLAKLEADSQSRLAEPVAYLIIAIFTASIYFRQGIASNYKLVAVSLLYLASISLLQHFCLAVSIGGGLSVMFGVWGPIALGAIISLWSFQRAER